MRVPLLFLLSALCFCSAAAFHASAALEPTIEPRMGLGGHLSFVGINLATAVGLIRRPRWFVAPFALLVLQQLISHGAWGLAAWREGWFDWRSLLVVVSLPPLLVALILDVRSRG